MRTLFFAGLDVDVLVMTMPDLQTFHIKRSPHSVKYVYLHHSLVSTHMIYRPAAFDHFDVILCVGPHHEQEIRAREALQGLPQKQLVQHGYGRLDTILAERVQGPTCRGTSEPINVLVAPTWGEHGLLESHAHELVKVLLSASFRVIVRPHPRTIKLKPDLRRDLFDAFGSHELFAFDDQPNARTSLLQADIMISDWSGAALEFAMGLERPVLFIDVPRKILNSEYQSVSFEPLESSIREELGVILKPEELHKSPEVLRDMFNKRSNWQSVSRTTRKRWVFNEGSSGRVAASFLQSLISSG
jgi:YidC/Oxa1 family membrane protein insertase